MFTKPDITSETEKVKKKKLINNIIVASLIACAGFLLDLNTPLGVAGGVPYVLLMITGWWFKSRIAILLLAITATILTVLGFYLSPDGGIGWVVLINRGYAIGAVWAVAIVLLIIYGNFRESNIIVEQSDKNNVGVFLKGWEGLFVSLLSIFILFSSWLIVSRIQQQEIVEIDISLQAVLNTAHIGVKNQFEAQKSFAKVWADNEQIKNAAEQLSVIASYENDTSEAIADNNFTYSMALTNIQLLLNSVLETTGYRGFFIIGNDNINLASSRTSNIGVTNLLSLQENFLERVWSGETLTSLPQKSDVPLEDESGQLVKGMATMFVATPIFDSSGNVLAILSFRLDPHDIFSSIFKRGYFGNSGETYTFDESGLLMSHIRFEEQVKKLGLIGDSDHAVLSLYIKDPGFDLTTGKAYDGNQSAFDLTHMVTQTISGNSGINHQGYRDYRGVRVLGAWLWDQELGLGFATEIDVEEAYSSFYEIRIVIFAFAGLSVGTLIVLVLVFRQSRKELSKRARELDFQKFALDQHAIVSIADVDGNIVYANNKFSESSGYSKSELIGQNHRILKSGEHAPKFYKDMWGRLGRGDVWQGEVKNKAKNGNECWYMSTKVPFMDSDGKPFRYISISTDITERKEAEIVAMAANRAKSNLMANMSHELRTPLNAIIGFSSMMKDELFGPVGNEKYLEYLGDVHGSAEHLLDLIVDILDVSAIEAGALELQEEDMDICEVADASVRIIKPRAAKGQVSIQNSIHSDIPLIFADKRRVKQIILNLLSNAVKFTVEGGIVTIDANIEDNGSLNLFVIDNGVGMDDDEIRTALSTFGQVENGFDRQSEGTGLGLPLTKGLVEMHDGKIKIESEKGIGTTIKVTFPRDRVVQPEETQGKKIKQHAG